MKWPPLLTALTGLMLAAAAPAAQWGPNGNGTLATDDDHVWTLLHTTKLTLDEANGEYRATFTPPVLRLDGTPFAVSGYLLPLSIQWTTNHFILTRRSSGCPFCPPSDPIEAIEIFFDKPVAYTDDRSKSPARCI